MSYNLLKLFISFISFFHILFPLQAQTFDDKAETLNIDFAYQNNGNFGGGVSFIDFDDDGLDDICFTSEENNSCKFYKNTGTDFELLTDFSILTDYLSESKHIIWVDFDNDGDKDLFLSYKGCKLFRQDGINNFVDITASSGLPEDDNILSFGATWGDINNDGFLDLYLTTRYFTQDYHNYLYKNNGNETFTDITEQAGVSDNITLKAAFMPVFLDINNDNYLDIYLANDKNTGNTLLKNNGNETFSNITLSSGTGIFMDGMGIAVGDYDNNSYLDIYITNTPSTANKLLKNNGDETFTEVASDLGVTFDDVGWGANFVDFDNDTDLDLYAVGGVLSDAGSVNNKLYINDGNGNFSISNSLFSSDDEYNSFGMAIGDWNNDGFYDFVVSNNANTNAKLWENSGNMNNWVKLDLIGNQSNRDAIGTRIEYFLEDKKYTRFTHSGISYISQNSSKEILGLANYTQIDSMYVYWSSGTKNTLYNIPALQSLNLEELAQPTDLQIDAITGTQVTLTWTDNAINETNFILERSINTSDNFTELINITENTTTYTDNIPNTTDVYFYRVKAENTQAETSYSNLVSTDSNYLINPPSNPIASPISNTAIRIDWEDNIDNETNFVIEKYDQSIGSFVVLANLEANTTSYVDTDLDEFSTNQYRLKAVGSITESDYTSIISATTIINNPSNLTATLSFTNTLTLNWQDDSDYEHGFQIEYSLDGTNFQLLEDINSPNITNYEKENMEFDEGEIFFRIKSYNLQCASAYSTVYILNAPLNTPTNLLANQISHNSVGLDWIDNSNLEVGFSLERRIGSNSFQEVVELGSNQSEFQDNTVEEFTNYVYRVKALSTEASLNSNYSTVVTLKTKLNPPSDLEVMSENGVLNLTWQDNSEQETTYIIERKEVSEDNFSVIANITSNSQTYIDNDENLEIGSQYIYRVKVANGTEESDYSNEANTIVTNLENSFSVKQINIYPVPTLDKLSLSFENKFIGNFAVEVLDKQGKSIKSFKFTKKSQVFTKELDLSNLENGIYILKITTDNQEFSKKIIKN